MIDAAIARVGWAVLGLAIAATIGVRLATSTCELPGAPSSESSLALAQRDAALAQRQLARMERELRELDRRIDEAMRTLVQAHDDAERARELFWQGQLDRCERAGWWVSLQQNETGPPLPRDPIELQELTDQVKQLHKLDCKLEIGTARLGKARTQAERAAIQPWIDRWVAEVSALTREMDDRRCEQMWGQELCGRRR